MSRRKTGRILPRLLLVLYRSNTAVHISIGWKLGFGRITDSERCYGSHSGKDLMSFV